MLDSILVEEVFDSRAPRSLADTSQKTLGFDSPGMATEHYSSTQL